MKFGKLLEDEAIPEWKAQYFDYKQAKKKLTALEKAIQRFPTIPRATGNAGVAGGSSLRDAPVLSFLRRRQTLAGPSADRNSHIDHSRTELQSHLATDTNFTPPVRPAEQESAESTTASIAINERTALNNTQSWKHARQNHPPPQKRMQSYGSIIGSPPEDDAGDFGTGKETSRLKHQPSSLRLPNPAIPESSDPDFDQPVSPSSKSQAAVDPSVHTPPTARLAHAGKPYKTGSAIDYPLPINGSVKQAREQFGRSNSTPVSTRPFARRFLSVAGNFARKARRVGTGELSDADLNIALEAYGEQDARKSAFFQFLHKELLKIENFYALRESTAEKHLTALRDQLHILRERRLAEIEHRRRSPNAHNDFDNRNASEPDHKNPHFPFMHRPGGKPKDLAQNAIDHVRNGHIGKTSRAMSKLGTPSGPTGAWQPNPDQRDFSIRRDDVAHATAKRKLKAAFAEYFRSLELLKEYSETNRTAFRKIIKKYDKTVMTEQKGVFMKEHINTAHFVASKTIDNLMERCEDLYARYFERGVLKQAKKKLESKLAEPEDFLGAGVRAGALLAAGAAFGLMGLIGSIRLLYSANNVSITVYLLQLYAGYFFMALLGGLFCLDAAVFTKYKVNYQLIFETPNKNRRNWLQALEVPAFFFFLMALAFWLNFDLQVGGRRMFVWWFIVLIALSITIFMLPMRTLYWRTRLFIVTSLGRLAIPGFFEVQFKDFFLGDMFCSLTYSMGNIELFFCLYARDWTRDLAQCSSSHSRLLGFFSAVPGIIRAAQCIRRYVDSHAVFPHLFNCMKYICTILQYVSLSVYRINHSNRSKAFFIVAACVNSVYCSYWDLQYDWSLLDRKAPDPWLRKYLAYKKIRPIYYLAMLLDPILRFNWIFYIIFAEDLQHASLVSFLVALSEVFRRAVWVLLRVENEHATNVAREKASLDYVLPYDVEVPARARTNGATAELVPSPDGDPAAAAAAADTDSPIARALYRVGTTVRLGHQADYVKKKAEPAKSAGSDDDDDDDSDDE